MLTTIPKHIYQTYKYQDTSLLPDILHKNLNENTRGYNYTYFNDQQCEDLLKTYFKPIVVDKFKSMKGAHKADLFRYCLLYIQGGIYIDIKTILLKPLDSIFTKTSNAWYTVDGTSVGIYQGIIATPAYNPVMLILINHILRVPNIMFKLFYHVNVIYMKKVLKTFYGKLCVGINSSSVLPDLILFKEICKSYSKKQGKIICNAFQDTPDQYNYCCNVYDKDNNIMFGTRYPDFPWK